METLSAIFVNRFVLIDLPIYVFTPIAFIIAAAEIEVMWGRDVAQSVVVATMSTTMCLTLIFFASFELDSDPTALLDFGHMAVVFSYALFVNSMLCILRRTFDPTAVRLVDRGGIRS